MHRSDILKIKRRPSIMDEEPPVSPSRLGVNHTYEPHCTCSPRNIERLRRFLAFCLAIDYGLHHSSPNKPTQADFVHFASLATKCHRNARPLPGFQHKRGLVYDNSVHVWLVADTQIECQLLDPANALRIPHGVVLSMLRIFVGSVRTCGYKSRVRWIREVYGLETVAGKLLFDREVLIEKVVRDEGLKGLMRERLGVLQGSWFARLEGMGVGEFNAKDRKDVVESWESVEKRHGQRKGWVNSFVRRVAVQADCNYAEQICSSTWRHAKLDGKLWWSFEKGKSQPAKEVEVKGEIVNEKKKENPPTRPRRRTSETRAPLIDPNKPPYNPRDNPFRDPSSEFEDGRWSLGYDFARTSFAGSYRSFGMV